MRISKINSLTKDYGKGYGVAGAEFKLYKIEGNTETEITGFKHNKEGHESYWVDEGGADKLETYYNKDDNGAGLCIHGLEPGKYKLVESKASEGYEDVDENPPSYTFEISKEVPKDFLDENGDIKENIDTHIKVNEEQKEMIFENTPKTANLEFTKLDGNKKGENKLVDKIKNLLTNNNFEDHEPLKNAYFTLYVFKGNDKDWANRKTTDYSKFEPVPLSKNGINNKYYKTDNHTEDRYKIVLPTNELLNGKVVPIVASDGNGKVSINNIPKGYYVLAEVKPPEGKNGEQFHVNFANFYFKVSGKENDKPIQLYRKINNKESAENKDIVNNPFSEKADGNVIFNFKRRLKIKLIKYDENEAKINPNGALDKDKHGKNTYPYNSNPIIEGKLLPKATYKLFQKEAGANKKPNPAELESKNAENIVGDYESDLNPEYDICKAIGTTNQEGILDISDMVGKNDKKFPDGLHMGNYYLIETKAPDGYMLDQTPIILNLKDEKLFEQEGENIGILKLAPNKKGQSAVRLIKKDEMDGKDEIINNKNLKGAEFVIYKKGNDNKYIEVGKNDQKEGEYELVQNDINENSQKEENILNRIKKKVVSLFKEITDKEDNIKTQVDNYASIDDIYKMKTNSENEFTLKGLKVGETYCLKEIKSPKGYSLSEKIIEFKAPSSKKIKIVQLKKVKMVQLKKKTV